MRSSALAPLAFAVLLLACSKGDDANAPTCGGGLRSQCIDDVAVGASFGCARLADRTVWCWGRNDQGQLGYPTTDLCPEELPGGKTRSVACHTYPFQVVGLTGAVAIDAGEAFSCAVMVDGSVRCWGGNANGQLGNGKTVTSQSPVVVEGLSKVTQLAVGRAHACALAGGQVWCWGAHDRGQLGLDVTSRCGPTPCASKPVAVAGLSNVTALSAGGAHTCALSADGMVTCFGDNAWGQLGVATAGDGPPSMPGDPDAGADAGPDVAADGGDAGAAKGARGNVLVSVGRPLTSVVALSSGGEHTCALRDGGDVFCWGRADHGELGAPPPAGAALGCPGPCSALAVPVVGLPPAVESTPDAGTDGAADGGSSGSSDASTGGSDGSIGGGSDAATDAAEDARPANVGVFGRAISSGDGFSCVRLGDGTVRCWGASTVGQLGDGKSTTAARPATLVIATPGAAADNPLLGVVKVRAGATSSCAVMADASLRCWGSNVDGALGVGHFTPQPGPVPVSW